MLKVYLEIWRASPDAFMIVHVAVCWAVAQFAPAVGRRVK